MQKIYYNEYMNKNRGLFMYYTVDRIEGEYAVVQDGEMNIKNINLRELPENIKEGDIIKFENNIYIIDAEKTKQVKKNIEERFKKMFIK